MAKRQTAGAHRRRRNRRVVAGGSTIADQLAELQTLVSAALRARWIEMTGSPAPKQASRDLILRALAYRIQEDAEGGLSKAARRALLQLASRDRKVAGPLNLPLPPLKEGTRLVREWRGETYEVAITPAGFEYRDAKYRSLSEIARLITGTRWSGPLFFGLRKSQAVHPNGR